MKATTIKLVVLGMTTALFGPLTMAQQASSSSGSSQPSGQAAGTSYQEHASAMAATRLTKLIGADVKSNTGEDLGKLDDLLADPMTGRIHFAILGRGGLLGIGEKRVPVPWQALSMQSEKQFTLNVDKEKLKSAPTVKSDYSELNDPNYLASVYQFFGVQSKGLGAGGQTPGGTGAGSSTDSSQNQSPPLKK